MYMQGSPVGIQTPSHWNLIVRSMTSPPPVIAQQYSSATFVSLCSHSRTEKFGAHVFNFLYFTEKKTY
jgi:hypothetical protein